MDAFVHVHQQLETSHFDEDISALNAACKAICSTEPSWFTFIYFFV